MSTQRQRLSTGGRIERSRTVGFTFNGRRLEGHPGDTLASALMANDVSVVARSFKYHRPRGIFGAGVEEVNALLQVGSGGRSEPNVQATCQELYEGLEAASPNCWPSVNFDVRAVTEKFSRLLPAGFYYKTFMWPQSLWPHYEDTIRKAGGIGKAPTEKDPDRYEKCHAHADVVVIGGGPTGIAAALAAGRSGARVILVDEQNEFGGSLLGRNDEIAGDTAMTWVAAALAELEALPEVRLLARTTVFGYYVDSYLSFLERVTDHLGSAAPTNLPRQRLWKVRAKQVVLATGAIERPFVFCGNDRPGIMLASAAQTYVNRYAVKPGSRTVVFTNNDSAYGAALDLAAAGVTVSAVVDLRPDPQGALPARVRQEGIQIIGGSAVVDTRGRKRLQGIDVMAMDGGALKGEVRRIGCDLLALSGGWNPSVNLYSQNRGKLRYDDERACFVPAREIPGLFPAGGANGSFPLADCLNEGLAAGAAAARAAGFKKARKPAAPKTPAVETALPLGTLVIPKPPTAGSDSKRFVDLDNDTSEGDILLADREGYRSIEHVKRYTASGMGFTQGKTGNLATMAVLAGKRGVELPDVGTTTFRPPYTPVSYGAFTGRTVGKLWDPIGRTPMHHWNEERGAHFENIGQWKRAEFYPETGESMRRAVDRECLAVRSGVAMLDASTLGKIDIQGADALKLLNWVYINAWDSLAIGKCRYGVMLGEDGMVMDDGVTARLGENHYLMTTTSGGAPRVFGWLEHWLQTEWPHYQVYLTSVTTQWATINVAGPKARDVLTDAGIDIDLDPEAFPFMSLRDGTVAGIPARVFRVSFTGELSFEINVRASFGLALWKALMAAGEKHGIMPYGLEAMETLRTEKGYFVSGHETDGTITPDDLGLGRMVSKKKADFLGKRSLSRPHTSAPGRKQLVGLKTDDPNEVLPVGAHVVEEVRPEPPMPMAGHVTSSFYSAPLNHSVAFAVIKNGHTRHGEKVTISLVGRNVTATVVDPRFYDPEGKRLHG